MIFINTGISQTLEKKLANKDILTKKMKTRKINGTLATIQFRVILSSSRPRSISVKT
jgi:hypothetical protein